MNTKMIYSIQEVAESLGVAEDVVLDLINCGDLIAIGTKKDLVRTSDLSRFMEGTNYLSPVGPLEVCDISESEWEQVETNKIGGHKPYWNEGRQKWCIALDLGFKEDGKRNRKVIMADTIDLLNKKYGEFRSVSAALSPTAPVSEISNQFNSDADNILFKDYMNKYLNSINNGSGSFATKMSHAPLILNDLGHLKMSEINKNILRTFITSLTTKTYVKGKSGVPKVYSQSSINKIYDLLHNVIKEASSDDGDRLLRVDFMQNIEKPTSNKAQEKYDEDKPFTDDEIRTIINGTKSKPMINLWVHLMSDLGVRPSEALALKFSDINYEKKTVSISRTLSKTAEYDANVHKRTSPFRPIITVLKNERRNNKTNYQKRTLRVSNATLSMLNDWDATVHSDVQLMELKKEKGTEQYLFNGPEGQFWTFDDYKQVYERTLESYANRELDEDIDITKWNPYRFRHTVCTDLIRQGVNIKTVQLILGDNSPQMVMSVYANLNKDDILNGSQIRADRMDEILDVV